jgi:orotate phosphoribosyltransferase
MSLNVEQIYKDAGAYLEGHFKLSSGNYSKHYLQSAKVLEQPATAKQLADALAEQIQANGIAFDTICSPALGGLIAGYALASSLDKRYIFAERVEGEMTIRRGFEVKAGEKVIICEDIITTGGSALEAAKVVESMGGEVVGYAALANRGFCHREGSELEVQPNCKLPSDLPFFALADFNFKMYTPDECDFKEIAYKPGSRGN